MECKVSVQEFIKGDNPFGNGEWKEIDRIFANKEWLKGKEFFSAQQINSEVPVKFVVNYKRTITSEMRIVDSEGTYGIENIQPFNSKEKMIIYAKEVKPSA